jgi:hypothetical protein
MAARELAAGFELRFGRGRREARRERIHLAPVAVPAADQLGAVVVARLRGVAQELGAVAVHQHLAGDHPQSRASLAANSASADCLCTVQ